MDRRDHKGSEQPKTDQTGNRRQGKKFHALLRETSRGYILWTHPMARDATAMLIERLAGHSLHLRRKVAAPCSAAKFREEKPYAEKNCTALTYGCIPYSLQAEKSASCNLRVLILHGRVAGWRSLVDCPVLLRKHGKTQRENLSLMVATMLSERSANLMSLAAALPRPSDRIDMQHYQWIVRVLANPLIECDAVMLPFAREVLGRAQAETGARRAYKPDRGSGSNRTKSSFQRDAPAQAADIIKLMQKTYL